MAPGQGHAPVQCEHRPQLQLQLWLVCWRGNAFILEPRIDQGSKGCPRINLPPILYHTASRLQHSVHPHPTPQPCVPSCSCSVSGLF